MVIWPQRVKGMSIYSEVLIEQLIKEIKPLPADYQSKIALKPKGGHKERELKILGDNGSHFRIILRVSMSNPMAFSVILGWVVPGSNRLFHLRRYDGKSHWHTNKLEKETFYDFHVHYATERYQLLPGFREDHYAVVDSRFVDYYGSAQCLFDDCAFLYPANANRELFDVELGTTD